MATNCLGWSWIRGLRLPAARIGAHPHEQHSPQPVVVDLGMQLDVRHAAAHDSLDATADWDAVVGVVRVTVAARHYQLVETLCEALAAALLADQPRVRRVRVHVHKPESLEQGMASVEIERSR